MKRNKSEGDAEREKTAVDIANKVTQSRKQRLVLKEGRRGGLVSTQKTLGVCLPLTETSPQRVCMPSACLHQYSELKGAFPAVITL